MVVGSLCRRTWECSLLGVVVYLLHLSKLGTTTPRKSSGLLSHITACCCVIQRANLEPEGWVEAIPFGWACVAEPCTDTKFVSATKPQAKWSTDIKPISTDFQVSSNNQIFTEFNISMSNLTYCFILCLSIMICMHCFHNGELYRPVFHAVWIHLLLEILYSFQIIQWRCRNEQLTAEYK